MDYFEAAFRLKQLIKKTNAELVKINRRKLTVKNMMVIRTNFGNEIDVHMEAFTNDFVNKKLKEYAEPEAFVITDLVTMNIEGKELTFYMYKGYHSFYTKGVVYFQLVDKESLKPIGELEYSNLEENTFYHIPVPDLEVSSCSAMETDENTTKNPSIAFLIRNMNEERLLFDIEQLVFETANNVQKHKNRSFTFFLRVSKVGGSTSVEFKEQIEKYKKLVQRYITPEYLNSTFIFDLEE
jgi:hypothetical protein